MVETNQLYILDASVLLKLFLEETEGLSKALKIKEDYINKKIRLRLPNLCLYEFLNTLGKKSPDKTMIALSQILMLSIEEQNLNMENSYRAILIMQQFPKVSFYDTIYHAIAIQHNGIFITADEKYYKQTKSLKHIQLLKDYK